MDGPCRIRVLPELLVNKIAAGEVVERPASVVKELLENALDAGATRISVAVEEGGGRLIRVTDNGCGLSAAELRLAVTPHATSKVATEEDLYNISTMGFRGEALASIGAVSQLRMVSRLHGALEGAEIRVCGDKLEFEGPAGGPEGTTVEVRDLFFNVPARRKFMRSPSTETGHLNEQFIRLALAQPGVEFQLSSNGRVTNQLPAVDDHLPRIARFYGPELSEALLTVRRDERGLDLLAYLAPPALSRAAPQWQYVYVNGRFVRDRFVAHAIREAYRGLMDPGRHSVVFLFLRIDPSRVDVNVHPTKTEVRWADSNLIHSQVLSALRETLQRAELAPALRTRGPGESPLSEEEQDRLRHELAAVLKSTPPIQGGAAATGPVLGALGGEQPPAGWPATASRAAGLNSPEWPGRDFPLEAWRAMYRPTPPESGAAGVAPSGPPDRFDPVARGLSSQRPRAIQMHNLYLVAETEEGIVIVDQHALHERVMYEQLRQRFINGPLESQRLLLPESIRVTPAQAAALETHGDLLNRLGIEAAPFGPESVAVHAFPALLRDADVGAFMVDLLDRLTQSDAPEQTESLVHAILDMMACKAAVKAGDPLTQEEIEALLRQRDLVDNSSSCPHGRPTMLRFTKADLNRQFKRT